MRQSLNHGLSDCLGREGREVSDSGKDPGRLLVANGFDGFAGLLQSFFAGYPYQWQGSDSPARYETWFAGMLYACFRTIGLDLRVEDASSRDRADMVVFHGGQVLVFEFMVAHGEDGKAAAELAIGQIQDKGCADKYRDRNESIHLGGVSFNREDRNLAEVQVVPA